MKPLLYKAINFKKITEEDLPFINEIRNEYAQEFLHDSRTFTLNETIQWFKTTNPKYWIILYGTDKIGYFRTSNYSEYNKHMYIGADIHKSFINKNLGYKSYLKFLPFIFNEFNLHKVSLEVLSTNKRAIHLYKKIGFKIDGIKREEILKNDKWVNSIIMSIKLNEINYE